MDKTDDDPTLYAPNHETDAPRVVACFDTDYTIDYAKGPVPLRYVEGLRDRPDVSVWATGHNQTLRAQAGIPGIRELNVLRGEPQTDWVERPDRMRALYGLYPGAERYYVVDDCDLSMLRPEWEYHTPGRFAQDELGHDDPDVMEPRFEYQKRQVGGVLGRRRE